MPKLSVYVPDNLWDQARGAAQGRNVSQLIQDGLRAFLAASGTTVMSTPPIEEARLAQVAAKKAAQARKGFEAGYGEGLDLAEEWPWEALDWLARVDFDAENLEDDDFPEFYTEDSTADKPLVVNPSLIKERYDEVVLGEGRLFRLGVKQALRDVWEAVLAPE